ncbi:hypothetical protein H0H92_011350 [Tricholoma furcatifolium]|nr:hypothetical protein H0H92_011350 [Tricholoma furcatifolium]
MDLNLFKDTLLNTCTAYNFWGAVSAGNLTPQAADAANCTLAEAEAVCKCKLVCGIPGRVNTLDFDCVDVSSTFQVDSCGGCVVPPPFLEIIRSTLSVDCVNLVAALEFQCRIPSASSRNAVRPVFATYHQLYKMAQSVEERRQKRIQACQKYRDRNQEKMRASARERMRCLRARRKEENQQNLNVAIENVILAATNEGVFDHTESFDATQRQSIIDNLPPSSEPEHSDSSSDISDPQFLPEVTCSSDEEDSDWRFDVCQPSSSEDGCLDVWETSSSDDERSVPAFMIGAQSLKRVKTMWKFEQLELKIQCDKDKYKKTIGRKKLPLPNVQFIASMSSPVSSQRQVLSSQPGNTNGMIDAVWRYVTNRIVVEFLEAKRRLATAHEALKAADAIRSKVLAIPLKRKGGGAARKQVAAAAYESALQAFRDCQAEVSALAGSHSQSSTSGSDADSQVTAPIHPKPAEEMDIDNTLDDSVDAEGDEDMVVDGQGNIFDDGADFEGFVDKAGTVEDGEDRQRDVEDGEGDFEDGEDRQRDVEDGEGDFEDGEDGEGVIEDGEDGEGVVEDGEEVVEDGEDREGVIEDGEEVVEDGEGVVEDVEEAVEDGAGVVETEDAGSMSVLSEDEMMPIKAPVKKGLEGLITMDELPDDGEEMKPTAVASKATTSKSKDLKAPVFYKRKKATKVPVRDHDNDDSDSWLLYAAKKMTAKQLHAYEAPAKDAIEEFLRYPNTTTIDPRLRKIIRENASFMPIAATKNRQLALHILTSNRGNVMCVWHHFVEKTGYTMDGQGKHVRLRGIPRPRKVNHVISDGVKRPKGYCHCGCSEEVALLDFYFWKTWTISGKLPGGERITETMMDPILQPRIRSFVLDQFWIWTGLTVDDLYQGKRRKDDQKLDMLHAQMEHILGRINKVAEKVNGEKYYLAVEETE